MQSAPFHQWVADTINDLGGDGADYLSRTQQGLASEWSLTLVSATADFSVVACQVKSYSKEQALARFSGLSPDCFTVFH